MIPIFKPYMPESLDELNDILHSGVLSYGKWGRQFEKKLSEFLGVEEVITTNSYNSAILVLLTTLGLNEGDEVLASPMSCLASNQPFITHGLKVKWVDIDPNAGTMDPLSLQQNITSATKAIFHNHYCGIPGHIDEINLIALQNNLIIVDDCIEAFGSEYKGKMLGNTGADAAIYSFQTVRLPNTIDGGALTFKNPEYLNKAKKVRDYGIDRALFRDKYNEINPACDINLPGYGALMSEVNSYIGCQQMKNLPELLTQQRNNAIFWKSYFNECHKDVQLVGFRENIYPNFWVFGLLSERKIEMRKYFSDLGYYASGIHINNNVYSVFGKQSELMGVRAFHERHLALPCGWWIKEKQLNNAAFKNNKPQEFE